MINDIIANIELVKMFTKNDLKVKYKRSVLGLAWSLLNPMINIGVISLVFSKIMGMEFGVFIVFFFPGFLCWTLFANSILSCSQCLINNEGLLKKIPINPIVFPAIAICNNVVEFLLALVSLCFVAVLIKVKLTLSLLILPYAVFCLLAFTAGLGLILSIITAYYRDIGYLSGLFIQFLFYLTPILYPKAKLESIPFLLEYNPMVVFVDMFRIPVYQGVFPPGLTMVNAFILGLTSILTGAYFFRKNSHKVVFCL